MRFSRMMLFALLLVSLLAPSAATASGPPLDLEMTVPTTLSDPGTADGVFTAEGPAVDDGLVCGTGDTFVLEAKASGFQSERLVNISVKKEFVCDDGSGSFFVKLQVHYDFTKTPEYNVFNWTIMGGTDAYEHLHGSGSGMGLYFGPGVPTDGVLDLYDGTAH